MMLKNTDETLVVSPKSVWVLMLTKALVLPELMLADISICGYVLTLLEATAPSPVRAKYKEILTGGNEDIFSA